MNVGNLYQTKKFYWMLFPTKDIAVHAEYGPNIVAHSAKIADRYSEYWNRNLGCKVSYLNASSIFMLLEQTGTFSKVLSTNGEVGWIIFVGWYRDDIEEVKV